MFSTFTISFFGMRLVILTWSVDEHHQCDGMMLWDLCCYPHVSLLVFGDRFFESQKILQFLGHYLALVHLEEACFLAYCLTWLLQRKNTYIKSSVHEFNTYNNKVWEFSSIHSFKISCYFWEDPLQWMAVTVFPRCPIYTLHQCLNDYYFTIYQLDITITTTIPLSWQHPTYLSLYIEHLSLRILTGTFISQLLLNQFGRNRAFCIMSANFLILLDTA